MTNFFKASEDETRAWVNDCIFHNNARPRFAHNCAILSRSDAELIGWIGFGHASDKSIGDRDFGYALRRDHWNRGYMTESLTAMLRFCFADPVIGSVFGCHRSQNPASGRVMQKSGMRYVGTFPSASEPGVIERRYIAFRGEWLVGASARSRR